MKQLKKNLTMYLCMFMAVFCAMTLKAEAGNVRTGTLGDNGGILWTYDEDTKTLTITGEDSGLQGEYDATENKYKSPFAAICADVEVIKVQNCTLKKKAEFMFANLTSLKRVEFNNCNTTNVTKMNSMFYGCGSLSYMDVSCLDTSNVTDMSHMFYRCSNLTALNLSNFDTSKVTDMRYMFGECSSLTALDVRSFNTANVKNMNAMFYHCSSLNSLDVSSFVTSKVTDMSHMFYICSSLKSLNLSGFDTTSVGAFGYMFYGCSNLSSLDVSGFNTTNAGSLNHMFYGCSSLTGLDVSGFDTANVRFMNRTFSNCSKLTSLDVSKFNTSQVTDMAEMFNNCSSLKVLDVSGFDTSKVTDMSYMFNNCSSLNTLDVSKFNTSKVTDMSYMFYNCSGLSSLDVSKFDTGNVKKMTSMFENCSKVMILDVSNFVTSKVTDMNAMFKCCSSVSSLDVSKFDTSKVTDIRGLFASCNNLTSLDLRNLDFSALMYAYSVFYACDNLAIIYAPKVMPDARVIPLQEKYVDSQGNVHEKISKDNCGKILYKSELYPVAVFVERMYTVALGREAELGGLEFYATRLLAGDSNGACLAQSFLCSPEFLNKGYDDAQYVKVLYKTFFDREPAAEEVNYWVGQLNGGKTRAFVLAGFVNSVEFDDLCTSYGISRGFMREDGKPINPGIGRFAERLYTVVLERAGEKEGIEYWILSMANGVCTPKDAAKNFFLSPEYVSKKTSDVYYIVTLYGTFMDREPEYNEVEYWKGVLKNGATREQILEGFADSAEFKGIMANFGL